MKEWTWELLKAKNYTQWTWGTLSVHIQQANGQTGLIYNIFFVDKMNDKTTVLYTIKNNYNNVIVNIVNIKHVRYNDNDKANTLLWTIQNLRKINKQ